MSWLVLIVAVNSIVQIALLGLLLSYRMSRHLEDRKQTSKLDAMLELLSDLRAMLTGGKR